MPWLLQCHRPQSNSVIIQNRTSGGKRSPLHKPPFVKKTTTIDAIYVRFKTGPGAQAVDAASSLSTWKNTGRVDTSVWPTVSWTAATTSTGAEKLCIIQPTSCRAGVRDGGVSFFLPLCFFFPFCSRRLPSSEFFQFQSASLVKMFTLN